MCKDCGCGQPDGHGHTHPHDHTHPHTHDHDHEHGDHTHDENGNTIPRQPRVVELEQKILSKNDEAAEKNRTWLKQHSITAINLISSPGTGKTMLLEKTLEGLAGRVSCAVIAGDQQTDNDARRLAGKGAPVRQIETVSSCHLAAEQVGQLLPELCTEETQLLFIENVGNLVCPAAFDLGESFKVALLSTTEGEDKPVKYPSLFSQARVVVITKMDLAPHLEWDLSECRRCIQGVHPGVFTFELSAKTGEGLQAWFDYLERLGG